MLSSRMPSSWPASIRASTASAWVSGCFVRMFLGQGGNRLQESQDQGYGQGGVDQNLHNSTQRRAIRHWCAEKEKRQKAVEQDDDQNQAERGLQNFVDAPGAFAKHRKANQHAMAAVKIWVRTAMESAARSRPTPSWARSSARRRQCCPGIRGKKFADLRVEAVDVGDQGQQAKHNSSAIAMAKFIGLFWSLKGRPTGSLVPELAFPRAARNRRASIVVPFCAHSSRSIPPATLASAAAFPCGHRSLSRS